jgi:tetratricopeptide (TPR) repeat protein
VKSLVQAAFLAGLLASCVATTEGSASSQPPAYSLRNGPPPSPVFEVSQSIANGNLPAAREALEKARAQGNSEDDLSLASAVLAIAEERLGSAEKHLTAAAAARPELSTVDILRGRVDEMRGHWDDALEAYRSAARKDPESSSAPLLEARVLIILGRPADAAELLERAMESTPSSVELLRAAGEAYLAAKDYARAVPCLRQAHALDANDRAAFESLAIALYRLGRYSDAAALLDGHDDDTLPDHMRLLFGRSALLALEADLAVTQLSKCIAAFDKDPEVWLDLSRAQALAGRTSEARAAAERALALAPDSLKALLLLGHVHKLAGQSREAGACYARALRSGADPVLVAPLIEELVPAASSRATASPRDNGGEDCNDDEALEASTPKGHSP